jgi:peroxiredoxin
VAVYRKGDDDTLEGVKKVIQERSVKFPVLFDSSRKNSDTYGIRGMPVAYLVDSQGLVV